MNPIGINLNASGESVAQDLADRQENNNNNQNSEQTIVDVQSETTSTGLSKQQYAVIYDLIAEGEIEGLVNGPRSVFLNNTPLASGDTDFLYGAQGANTVLTANASGTSLTVSGSLPESEEESYRQVVIEGAGKDPGSTIFTLSAGSNVVTTNSDYFSSNQERTYEEDLGVLKSNQLEFLSEDGQFFTAPISYVDGPREARLNSQSPISGTFSVNAGTLYSNWETSVLTDFSSNTMTLTDAVLKNVTNARIVFSSTYSRIDELNNPWNFEGSSLSFFNGSLTQRYQPSSGGYSTASYLYSTNEALKQHADFTGGTASSTFVNPNSMNIANASDIDRFTVTIEGPSLISTSENTGREYQQPVEIQIFFRYQREGDNTLSDPVLVVGRNNPDPENPAGRGYFEAKTKKPYSVQFAFDVQQFQPFTDWQVEIKKVTSDSGQSEQYNRTRDTTLKGVQAQVVDHLNYRGTAYGIVQYSAKDFSQPPSRSYLVKGKLIKVPTNYITRDENDGFNALYTRNVTTGANTGSEQDWNGLFRGEPGSSVANRKKVYCDNPAWVFYDILTNPVYGLGDFIEKDLIDVYSLYQIAQYCDELVPNGEGGEEPRFTTNVIIESRQEAYKVLKDLATVFRGILYWLDGQVVAIQDSLKEPVFNFTQGNVINGMFTYEGQSSRVTRNRVNVTWRNPEKAYSSEAIVVDDLESIAEKNAILSDNIVAFGCTSKGQAIRAGKWYLETNARENEVIKFETGSNGSFILPGDIINVQDQERSFVEYSGRISNDQANVLENPTPDANTIHLDREVTLLSGSSYILHVYFSGGAAYLAQDKDATISSTLYKTGQLISSITSKEDAADATDDSGNRVQVYWSDKGHIQSAEVDESSSSGNVIQLTSGFSQIPEPDSIWALSTDAANVSEDLELSNFKQYRVLGIEEQEEGEYAIIASLYDATKYTIIDFGYPSNYDPNLGDPIKVPGYVPAPDELGLAYELTGGAESSIEDPEELSPIATAYWTPPEEKIPSETVDATTTLSTSLSEINNGTISVASSAGFKTGGGVGAILTGNGTVKEFFSYDGKSTGELTGVKRAFYTTRAYSHPKDSVVEDRGFETLPYRYLNYFEVQLDNKKIARTYGTSLSYTGLAAGQTYLLKVRTVGPNNEKSDWAQREITLVKELNTEQAVFDRVSSLGIINRLPSIDSATGEVNIAPAAFTIENPAKDTVTVDSVVTLDYGSLVDGETAYLYYDHSETTTSPVDAFKAVEVVTDTSWYASSAGAVAPEVYGSASWWGPLGDASNGLQNVSGTITTTLNRSKVIGSGTSFTTDFSSGDLIRFSTVNTPGTFTGDAWYSRVESVVSDTELYTVLPVTKVFTGSFAFKQSLVPQSDKDLLVSRITAEGSTEVYSIQTLILTLVTSDEALEAETVNLVASSYVAQYDGDGLLEIESPDNNITLTATPGGGLGVTEGLPSDVRYRFIDNSGVSPEVKQDWSTDNTYVIPELDLPAPGESLIYTVEATDASESPYASEASDQVTIIAISRGRDAETVNLVASSYVSKYDGTGALIDVSPANNITLTATPSAGLGSPIQYRFLDITGTPTVKQDWSTDNTYVISELDLPAVDTITTYTVEVTDGVSPYSSETSDNVTITAISDGATGPDGRPGLPGATVLLDYDDFQGVVSSAGQYQLSTDTINDADAGAEGNAWGNATAEAGTSPSIKAIFLHEQDSNSVDRSAELEQIQINDHITWYDSDGRWIDYSVTNILAKSGSVYGFEVNYVEHDETDGTGNISASPSIPILIRLSRALEPITGILTNESHAEAADQDGVLLNDFNDAGGTFKVYKGVEEVNSLTPAPSFSVGSPATVDGLTMSIDSAGVYSLSGSPAEWTGDQAIFELTATYQGVSVTKIYSIIKVPEGKAAINGYLNNEIHQEPADPDGQLTDSTPALGDAGGTFYVYDGLTNVTTSGDVEYSVVGGSGSPSTRTIDGLELSIDSEGVYSLSEDPDWTSDRVTFNLQAVYTGHTPSVTLFKNYTISKSKQGTTGINSATVYLYQRSDGLPSPSNPADGTIYTFATGNVQIGSPTNGWTTDIPEGLDPLYVIVATAASNNDADGIAANEWSDPVLFTGAGINTASVFVYQRTLINTAPSNKPAGVTTYTFETGNINFTTDNGWTATIPDESGGPYLWVTQATAANTTSTDTIQATEWSTIRLLSQVGADGSAGVNAQAVKLESSIYAFAYNAVDGTLDTVGTPLLTATAINFEASPQVKYRFTDLSDSTVIQDWNTDNTVDVSAYIPVAEESVSIQVEAGSGGSPVEATDTITLIGLQAGAPTISLSYTNANHTVSINNEGEYDWTGSGGLFEVFEGATPFSLGANGNNYTDHTGLTNGEYQLGINTVSGNNLVEPTVTSASDSPAVYATIGEFSGNLTQNTVYRITAYIKTSLGEEIIRYMDISFTRSVEARPGLPAASTLMTYDDLETTSPDDSGQYGFRTASGYTTTWSDLIDGSITEIRLHKVDTNSIDRSELFDQVGVGDSFTYYVSSGKWVQYEITASAIVTGNFYRWTVNTIQSDSTDGTGNLSESPSIDITWRLSRAFQPPVALDAQAVRLESDRYAVTYDNTGTEVDNSTITLTATPTNFEPSPAVQYRFTNLSDATVVQDWDTNNEYVIASPGFPGANLFDTYQVEAGSGGSPVEASDSLTIVGIQEGSDVITVTYTNSSHVVPVDKDGNETWTNSGGVLQVYQGADLLTLRTNTPTASHSSLINGQYQLSITETSGLSLTGPNFTGAGGTTATLSDFAGNLTALATFDLTIYIQDNSGNQVTFVEQISIAPSNEGADGQPGVSGASEVFGYDDLEATEPNLGGEYAFKYNNTYTETWTDIVQATVIQLYPTPTTGGSEEPYFTNTVQVNDIITYYISDTQWADYRITNVDGIQTNANQFTVTPLESRGSGDPDNQDNVPVTFRLSRPKTYEEAVPSTSSTFSYDNLQSGSTAVNDQGQYAFGNKSTASDPGGTTTWSSITGGFVTYFHICDLDENDNDQGNLFYQLEAGDLIVWYGEVGKWVAFEITGAQLVTTGANSNFGKVRSFPVTLHSYQEYANIDNLSGADGTSIEIRTTKTTLPTDVLVPPPDVNWGLGGWSVQLTENKLSTGSPDPGEILISSGMYVLPDGTRKQITENNHLTPFESSNTPTGYSGKRYSDDNHFYLVYRQDSGDFINVTYKRSIDTFWSVDNNGNFSSYSRDNTNDYFVAWGYRSGGDSNGIDNLQNIVQSISQTGENTYGETGDLLQNIDLRNDQLVISQLSAINFNPSMSIPQVHPSTRGTGWNNYVNWVFSPAGYQHQSASPSKPTYKDVLTRDIAKMTGGGRMSGTMIRVNQDTIYEISALVKSDSGTQAMVVGADYITSSTSDSAIQGKTYITENGNSWGAIARNGTSQSGNQFINDTNYSIVTYEFDPSLVLATYFSPILTVSGQTYYIDWLVIRDKSTLGATVGTDLVDSSGSTLGDTAVKNSEVSINLTGQTLSLNNAGAATATLDPGSVNLGNVVNERQNTIFSEVAAPSALAIGDLWVDTANGNKLYRATGTGTGNWVVVGAGTSADNITSGVLGATTGGTGLTSTTTLQNSQITLNLSGTSLSISNAGGGSYTLDQGNVGLTGVEDNADLTSANQAASIASQGALATSNTVDLTTTGNGGVSGILPVANTQAEVNTVNLGDDVNVFSNALRRLSGGTFTGDLDADLTSANQAATIASQGALATSNKVNLATTGNGGVSGILPVANTQAEVNTINAGDSVDELVGANNLEGVFYGDGTLEVNGTSVRKTASNGNWDAAWRAGNGYVGGVYISGTIVFKNTGDVYMLGLSDNPGGSQGSGSYTLMDYQIYVQNSAINIFEGNNNIGTFVSSFSVGSTISVVYDGSKVTYLYNSTLLRTVVVENTNRLYPYIAMRDVNAEVANVSYGPVGSTRWGDIAGVNRPDNNADVTSANQAATIASQGALATSNTVNLATTGNGGVSGILPVANAADGLKNTSITTVTVEGATAHNWSIRDGAADYNPPVSSQATTFKWYDGAGTLLKQKTITTTLDTTNRDGDVSYSGETGVTMDPSTAPASTENSIIKATFDGVTASVSIFIIDMNGWTFK